MTDKPIILYTSNYCGHARSVERFFEDYEIKAEVINIDEIPGAREQLKALNRGYASVPTLIFPDGTQLTEPPLRIVREKLGIEIDGPLDRVRRLFSDD